ncbi:MAG: hypothetical protein AAAFM81_12865 [Pseudomonadota bacterium]
MHNAVFLDEYPNLPTWFTPAGVVGVLLVIHLVGLIGLALTLVSRPTLGLVFFGLYAVIGFDGLAHYSVAAFSSHTLSMNLTILVEVATAFLLLLAVLNALYVRFSDGRAVAS